MSTEKNIPSQNSISQEEETKPFQSVLFDREVSLLNALPCSNPFIRVARGHREHARHVSFGGNLTTLSPLWPLNGEPPKEL